MRSLALLLVACVHEQHPVEQSPEPAPPACAPVDPCVRGQCGTFSDGCGKVVTCECKHGVDEWAAIVDAIQQAKTCPAWPDALRTPAFEQRLADLQQLLEIDCNAQVQPACALIFQISAAGDVHKAVLAAACG